MIEIPGKKMINLVWIISFVLLTCAEKEPLDNLDQLLGDPDIWQYIEKRVEQGKRNQVPQNQRLVNDPPNESPPAHRSFGDNRLDSQESQSAERKDMSENTDKSEKNHRRFPYFRKSSDIDQFHPFLPKSAKTISDSSGNSCTYKQNSSLIIRSKKSLQNGAAFLKSANQLSAENCARKCCYTQNCNLAVYEDKEEHNCYLFDCGSPSKCLFAPHANYTLLSFHETNSKMGEAQQHHENELENLGKTSSPQLQKQTTQTPAPKVAKVPLYGDCDIDWGQNCADHNAECRDEQCKCKEGYKAIYAYCRRICESDEFQCKNKGQDDKVPDCIDKKHWCDGVPQCADGSDEENCPDKSQDQKDKSMKQPDDQNNIDNTPSPLPPAIPKEESEEIIEASEESKEEDKQEDLVENKDSSKEDKDEEIQEESVTKTSFSVPSTPKVLKTTTKPLNLAAPDKVLIKSPTDSNQGPIVALALGLGICLMLLIFVGCRLRTVKRRIRRGKSLHSNEADYLINGMYL